MGKVKENPNTVRVYVFLMAFDELIMFWLRYRHLERLWEEVKGKQWVCLHWRSHQRSRWGDKFNSLPLCFRFTSSHTPLLRLLPCTIPHLMTFVIPRFPSITVTLWYRQADLEFLAKFEVTESVPEAWRRDAERLSLELHLTANSLEGRTATVIRMRFPVYWSTRRDWSSLALSCCEWKENRDKKAEEEEEEEESGGQESSFSNMTSWLVASHRKRKGWAAETEMYKESRTKTACVSVKVMRKQ